MERIDLFSTPVGIFDVEDNDEINECIFPFANKKEYMFGGTANIWQINDSPGLRKLQLKFLESAAELCNSILKENYKWRDFRTVRGWVNGQLPNAVGRVHDHGYASFAGTYYAAVDENSGPLTLVDPRSGISSWLQKNNSQHQFNYNFNPAVGKLILIPGWILHNVGPNESNITRISLSTNVNLK